MLLALALTVLAQAGADPYPPLTLYTAPIPPSYQAPQPQWIAMPLPPPVYIAPPIYQLPPPQPASTVLTYWVQDLPSRETRRAWQLAAMAAQMWSAEADLDLVPAASRAEANMVIFGDHLDRGVLGITMMGRPRRDPRNPRALRIDRGLTVRISHRIGANEDKLMLRVLTHEIGHALGIEHTRFGETMGPSVHQSTPFTSNDENLVAFIYGRRQRRVRECVATL